MLQPWQISVSESEVVVVCEVGGVRDADADTMLRSRRKGKVSGGVAYQFGSDCLIDAHHCDNEPLYALH